MSSGWVKLHRNIIECSQFRDGDWLKIWVCLMSKATHSQFDAFFGKEKISLSPGQLITSRRSLSVITGVQESKIERVLKRLKSEQKIEQQGSSVSRLITITNWDRYQKDEHQNEQRVNSERTASEQRVNTNKKVKKVKKVKKDNTVDFPFLKETAFTVEWDEFKRVRGNKFSDHAQDLALSKLHKFPIHVAIQSLKDSMMNNWKGLFPESVKVGNVPVKPKEPPQSDIDEFYRIQEENAATK